MIEGEVLVQATSAQAVQQHLFLGRHQVILGPLAERRRLRVHPPPIKYLLDTGGPGSAVNQPQERVPVVAALRIFLRVCAYRQAESPPVYHQMGGRTGGRGEQSRALRTQEEIIRRSERGDLLFIAEIKIGGILGQTFARDDLQGVKVE